MRRVRALLALTTLLACGAPPLSEPFTTPEGGSVIRVPEEQPSIQAGVDAAADGDTVLVAPGFYFEKVRIEGKRVTVASWYMASREPLHRIETVVSSRGTAFEVIGGEGGTTDARIVGFSIRQAKIGVVARARGTARIEDNRIFANTDTAIVGMGADLRVRGNLIRDHREGAGVLVMGASTLLAEGNRLDRNRVGVQLMLQPYEGDLLELHVRNNRVTRNVEGGVTVIPWGDESDRLVRIERNVLDRNGGAAVACRDRKSNVDLPDGTEMLEPLFVVQNTFVNNDFGVIGGDNVVAMNNLLVSNRAVGLLRLRDRSVAKRNGFWRNVLDYEDVPPHRRLKPVNPRFDQEFHLESGSGAIDAGLSSYVHEGVTVLPVGEYSGEAPDLGAFER